MQTNNATTTKMSRSLEYSKPSSSRLCGLFSLSDFLTQFDTKKVNLFKSPMH